jgi:phosphinothricin acetyltransferase
MQTTNQDAVLAIYAEGIASGMATFETVLPDWETWDQRHRPDCRLVAWLDEQVVGWAALSPVSARMVYVGVCEVSIYITTQARGQGIGKKLLLALIEASEAAGIWMLQAAIIADNITSIGLHHQCGFRVVGYRERIGKLNGVWHNTVLMERRSQVVGVD